MIAYAEVEFCLFRFQFHVLLWSGVAHSCAIFLFYLGGEIYRLYYYIYIILYHYYYINI